MRQVAKKKTKTFVDTAVEKVETCFRPTAEPLRSGHGGPTRHHCRVRTVPGCIWPGRQANMQRPVVATTPGVGDLRDPGNPAA